MITTKQSLICALVALFLTVGTAAFAPTRHLEPEHSKAIVVALRTVRLDLMRCSATLLATATRQSDITLSYKTSAVSATRLSEMTPSKQTPLASTIPLSG